MEITEMKYIQGENHNKQERIEIAFRGCGGTDWLEIAVPRLRQGIKNHQTERGFWIDLPDDARLDMLRLAQENRERILLAYPIKTRAGWSESGISEFREYCKPGDRVDEAMVEYFRGSVPPVAMRAGFLQAGDPVSSVPDEAGSLKATYTTFSKKDGSWAYRGACFYEQDINRIASPWTVETEIKKLEQICEESKEI